MKYNSFSHHSVEYGYQNVNNAKEFAEFVVNKLTEMHPNEDVTLIGVDGSSVFLAAFIKMLRPNWQLVIINKDYMELKNSPINDIIIFADDYLHRGLTLSLVRETMGSRISYAFFIAKSTFYKLHGENLEIFTMQS